MLIELFGQNFGCFRDEFRLSMLATDIDPQSPRGVVEVKVEGDDEPIRLLRAVAIYGANASGKSTVLRAANILRYLIEGSGRFRSDQTLIAFHEAFALDRQTRNAPVSLGVRGVVDHSVYEYLVRYDRARIVEESLIRSSGEEQTQLFHRRGQTVEGPWTLDQQFGLLTASFRPNGLLLSLADALAPSLARGIAAGLRRLLGFYDPTTTPRWSQPHPVDPTADRAATDAAFAEWLTARIRDVDIGVVGYETKPIQPSPRMPVTSAESVDDTSSRKAFRLTLLHSAPDGPPVALHEARESRGTRRFLDLTPYFYDISKSAAAVAFFVDELDASLHPVLLDGLLRHFNCELPNNSVQGQLIFATHETSLFDDEAKEATLRRDQIYFTEKNSAGVASLYSLAEFKERNNLNIRRRYLQGRYGALPSLGEFAET